MSGLGTGICGYAGCENPCQRDEDFCCTGCEEAAVREDEETVELAGGWSAEFAAEVAAARAPQPSIRERIEALPRARATLRGLSNTGREEWVKLSDVLALFDPECSLCEQGHVPARPCAPEHPAVAAFGTQTPVQSGRAYPCTEFDEDAGVWVEWESEGIGRVVPAPEGAVERRVEPGF